MKKFLLIFSAVSLALALTSCADTGEGEVEKKVYTTASVGPFKVFTIKGDVYDGQTIPDLYLVQDASGEVFGTKHTEPRVVGRVVTATEINTIVIGQDKDVAMVEISKASVDVLCAELKKRLDDMKTDDADALDKYKKAYRLYKSVDAISVEAFNFQRDLNSEIVGEK